MEITKGGFCAMSTGNILSYRTGSATPLVDYTGLSVFDKIQKREIKAPFT